ncbi:hypothetical protein ACFXJ5_16020 [Streptomyces sp. NPDC059373]
MTKVAISVRILGGPEVIATGKELAALDARVWFPRSTRPSVRAVATPAPDVKPHDRAAAQT